MTRKTRFHMIGGFLGAGKTPPISRLARRYQEQGLTVGIVTNDQAAGLVDTELLQSQGFEVGEVAGACFCCSFNQLTETLGKLEGSQHPDIILAEPVGSCTDLVATVAQPLMQFANRELEIGPYAVILKPSHGKKILRGSGQRGFSPQAEYIFRKQLEEADLLLVNRIDQLTTQDRDELVELLNQNFPGREILCISAKTGENIDRLMTALNQSGEHCRRILDIDYDIYAAGEAELGWLNANISIQAEVEFDLDLILTNLLQQMVDEMHELGSEVAHLKVIGQAEGAYAVANAISNDQPVQLSLASEHRTRFAELVVNARIAIPPETLEATFRKVLEHLANRNSLVVATTALNCLKPGRPVPTHRFNGD